MTKTQETIDRASNIKRTNSRMQIQHSCDERFHSTFPRDFSGTWVTCSSTETQHMAPNGEVGDCLAHYVGEDAKISISRRYYLVDMISRYGRHTMCRHVDGDHLVAPAGQASYCQYNMLLSCNLAARSEWVLSGLVLVTRSCGLIVA
ncbi:hypothetical protein CHU98_g12412 [Xylaria longipes]|nr:hypothetical protein CHU98_g12412 [Xylaria longipes]